MKKRIALLLFALLVLVAVFSSCNRAAATNHPARWEENESYTFNITLADFETDSSKTDLFKQHTVPVINDDGTEKQISCYKDSEITQEKILMSGMDEVRPVDVKGTFAMDLVFDTSDTRKLTTNQVLYSQYETKTLQDLDCLEELKDYDVTDKEENPFDDNNGRTTLKSTTVTWVIFNNKSSQQPVKSVKENTGFYIGKIHQGKSNYKVETTYDFDNRKITVKKDDGEATEKKINNGVACIDASQILLYIRSLDKTSAGFQSTPSVTVYEPVTDTMYTATFALNREFNAILNNNGENVGAKVHCVTVAVGNRPFMTQFNLPDLTKTGENEQSLDFLPTQNASAKECKFTTVKFRSGWISYELSKYDANWINAIKLK